MKNPITRWLGNALDRLFQGPQPEAPKCHTEGNISPERKPYDPPISSEALASKPPHGWFEHLVNRPETPGRRALATEAWLRGYTYGALTRATQPEHVDIEKLIHDTVARWHGDQFDRRPLAKVLTETLRPYLKKPAGYRYILSYELADNPGYEYEEYVTDVAEARTHLRGKTDMLVWATLTDQDGNEVCSSEKLR